MDYSLKRWSALVRYLHDGALPIDNGTGDSRITSSVAGLGELKPSVLLKLVQHCYQSIFNIIIGNGDAGDIYAIEGRRKII
jgi:hypothetical protein